MLGPHQCHVLRSLFKGTQCLQVTCLFSSRAPPEQCDFPRGGGPTFLGSNLIQSALLAAWDGSTCLAPRLSFACSDQCWSARLRKESVCCTLRFCSTQACTLLVLWQYSQISWCAGIGVTLVLTVMCNAGQEVQQTLHAGMLSFSCHLVDILCTSTLPSIPGLVVLAPAHSPGHEGNWNGHTFSYHWHMRASARFCFKTRSNCDSTCRITLAGRAKMTA